jgi:hypothetical protein
MVYRSEITVSRELTNMIDDEFLYRQLANKLIADIPIEDLFKLISFKKIDPNSIESREFILNFMTPHNERQQLLELKDTDCLIYKCRLNIE